CLETSSTPLTSGTSDHLALSSASWSTARCPSICAARPAYRSNSELQRHDSLATEEPPDPSWMRPQPGSAGEPHWHAHEKQQGGCRPPVLRAAPHRQACSSSP